MTKDCSTSRVYPTGCLSFGRQQHPQHPAPPPLPLCGAVWAPGLECQEGDGTGFGMKAQPPASDFLPCLPFPIPSLQESPQLLQTGMGVSLHGQTLEEGRSPGSSPGIGLLSRSSPSYTALSWTLAPSGILLSSFCTALLPNVGQEETTCICISLVNRPIINLLHQSLIHGNSSEGFHCRNLHFPCH